MTETGFAFSRDGFRIAYSTCGAGPPLLLLHGFGGDRSLWRTHGWLERLQPDFTVITMDLRGCGQSTASSKPEDYVVGHHLADVDAVLHACGVAQFRFWGWSFGATIGLHLAACSPRPTRVVIAGTYFGRLFTEEFVQPRVRQIEQLIQAQQDGTLHLLELSPAMQALATESNLPLYLARTRGLASWPGIEPGDVRCPALIYTGTRDGNVVLRLRRQEAAIRAAGLQLTVFDGLNHIQLLSESDVIWPEVHQFLCR